MVIGAAETAVGAEPQAGAGVAGRSRRQLARGLLASATALALAPVVAASRPAPPAAERRGISFDEWYRGRRIRGALVPVAGRTAVVDEWRITVDGHPLHLMRRADGSWLSMVDHYTSYPTPLAAARAAVDEIGPGQRLRDLLPGPMGGRQEHQGHRPGGHDGVRA
jgi:hypothetical protein